MDTSVDAAGSQTPLRLAAGRWSVLCALADHGPQTDFELADRTGYPQTGAGKRRLELQRDGLVEPADGERRASPTGTPAKVWRLTEAGAEVCRRLRAGEAVSR